MAGNREYKSDVFSMLLEEPGNVLGERLTAASKKISCGIFCCTEERR